MSTYSRLQADLTNLQREKDIRLQTQQHRSICRPAASLDDPESTDVNRRFEPSLLRKTSFIRYNFGSFLYFFVSYFKAFIPKPLNCDLGVTETFLEDHFIT